MNARRLVQVSLLVVVVATVALAFLRRQPTATESTPPSPTVSAQVAAYYFHGDTRCDTCRAIEKNSAATIQEDFASELSAGDLTWAAINTDRPENAHFRQDFQLTHSTLVLVEYDGDQVRRYTALDRVWELVYDPQEFRAYVDGELRQWLEGSSPS